METLKFSNADNTPDNQGRRDFLQIIMPGGWLIDVVRKQPLSPTAQKSLLLDAILLTPSVLASCAPTKPSPTTQPETAKKVDLGKQRLNEELDLLPNSLIRSLLFARCKPLFGANPPKSINYDGLEIKVFNPTVVLKTINTNSVSGLFTPRDPLSAGITPDPLYPTRETVLRLPYLGLVLDAEKSTIPASSLASDGTPLIEMTFPVSKPLYEGLYPVITVTTPEQSFIKPEFRKLFRNFERFCYIKEACSLLLVDIYIEEAVKRMHKLGLNITMEAKTPSGTRRQAEGLIQTLSVINHPQSRIAAAIDLAGYLLAFKATEVTDIDDPQNMDQGFLKIRPNMQAVKLGFTPQDILYSSFTWSLTTPEADRLLAHVGNIKNIP